MSIISSRVRVQPLALLLTLLAALFAAAPAAAAPTVTVSATPVNKEAMAYSDFNLNVGFPKWDEGSGSTPQSMEVDLPKGQLGAFANATECPNATWRNDGCANSAKVGEASSDVKAKAAALLGAQIDLTVSGGVYRIPKAPGGTEVGRLGISLASGLSDTVYVEAVLRLRDDGTYGIRTSVPTIPKTAGVQIGILPLGSASIRLKTFNMKLYGRIPGSAPQKGFFFNPAECIPAVTKVTMVTHDNKGAATTTGNYTPTNCAAAPFDPSVAFEPNPSAASSPTEFTVRVSQPYSATAAKVGSPFRETSLVMPAGVQLSGATNSDGQLAACTDAQFSYSALTPVTCPAGSKVGTVVMDSPLVGEVPGSVYLAQPSGGTNDIIRLFMVAELGPQVDAVRVKLSARVEIDATSGAMNVRLVDLPAQPVKSFVFKFRGNNQPGTRQPRTCGNYPGSADLKSFSTNTVQSRTSTYVVSTNCPPAGRFRPTVGMTVSPQTAGAVGTTGVTTIDLPVGDEPMAKLVASLPAGLLANINGLPRCTRAQVAAASCPAATKIGSVRALAGQSSVPGPFSGDIFLSDADPATTGAIAGLYMKVPVVVGPIVVADVKIDAAIKLRPDFGLDVVSDIPDEIRKLQLDIQQLKLTFDQAGFLVNPPVCTNTINGAFRSTLNTAASPSSAVTVTGCGSTPFDPTLAFTATPAAAGGTSALTTTITLPAAGTQSPPKKIELTLPTGVSLSPSAGSSGLAGCSDAQFTAGDFVDPTCPALSEVGTVAIDTPTIGALTGKAFLGTAVNGHTARLLLDAKSTTYGSAARVKLIGFVDVDEATGAVKATFDGVPPARFSSFALTLRGGSNAVLSMPRTCGSVTGTSVMTPHSGTAKTPSASVNFNVNCADAASFDPTFANTFSTTKAGASPTMTSTITVPQRHRALDRLALSLPAGLLANVEGAPLCPIANANAGTCPANTKLGDVTALAGQGTAPGTFSGPIYLTAPPSAGDVVGIAVEIPAVVGPIDLGKVITVASVKVRPSDYGIDVTAAIPTSAKGVPLHLQQLKLDINKAGFLTNPVDCSASKTTASLRPQGATAVTREVAFTATQCNLLGFSPTISFAGTPAAAAGASAFVTEITAPATGGQAALKKAVVDLPAGVALSSSINSANNLTGCTAAQFDQDTFSDPGCVATSEIGTASLSVPQVGALSGKVYLAQTAASGAIAGLYVDAKSASFGSAVRVKLAGRVDVDAATGKTTATFDNAPAVGFSSFKLSFRGGTAPAISMPRVCGTPSGTAALTPYSASTVTKTATLTVNTACGQDTKFEATGAVALSDSRAGQDTQLTTTINVPTGQRELSKVAISLPAGLLARIDGLARCSVADATAGTCAAGTKVGTVDTTAGQGTTPGTFSGDVFIVDAPSSSDIIALGLSINAKVGPIDLGKINVVAPVQLRSDYGIDIKADVPTQLKGIPLYVRQVKIAITKPGFLFNPSTCGVKTSTLTAMSAAYGGQASTNTFTSDQTLTACDQVGFDPSLSFSATPAKAGGSGAFTTRIQFPTSSNQAALGAVSVQLPAGLSLSPSIDSAGTLTGCTDAQFKKSEPATDPSCPAASAIGTTSVQAGSVGALTGKVYLSSTTPSGIARVFVYAGSASFPGARVKMIGLVDVNAATGITSAVFADAPPVPFTDFQITFRGGDNPAISLPRTCGTPSGAASFTSQASATPVNRTASLAITDGCAEAAKFLPTVTTTSAPTTAGTGAAFTTAITVPAGQQELTRVQLSLPAGLIAKIDGHARCSVAAAQAGTCAVNTKIGTITAKAGQGDQPATYAGTVYLTDAPGAGDLVGLAVELAVQVGKVGSTPIIDLGKITVVGGLALRTDYGVDVDLTVPTEIKGIPLLVRELALTLSNDFMVNPPTCTNAVSGTLSSKQSGTRAVSSNLGLTACTNGPFTPSVAFSSNPATPAAAASLRTELSVAAGGLPVKKAIVDLPTGVSLTASANAAGDLAGCTDAQFAASAWTDPTCPAGSKIGSVTIDTPSIGAITGDAYLADTAPGNAIARVLVDAKSTAFGAKARIKVAGVITVDPATGKTTATFDGLPPVAFTRFALDLRGGSKPVMSLPRTAGSFAGTAVLSTHGGQSSTKSGSLVLTGGPAVGQFGPTVDFALAPNGAGAAGKLDTTITVPGGDQELSKIKLNLPEGLTAKLVGAPRCSIAQAQADACPANTELGVVNAKVGVQGAPFAQAGKIYLTDGQNGNVAGMAIILPAKVGPIDLGKIVTIADVQLHSPDLALQITADVPTQLKGVRLDVRELKLSITKNDFLVNPSSCGPLTGTAAFTSKDAKATTGNGTITVAAGSCATQSFDPQLSFGASNPKPGEASDFTTTVTVPGTGSTSPFKAITVALPKGMSLSASAGARGDLVGCSDAQFKQDDLATASSCPAGSEIGSAKFETDLVGDLIGKAYLAPATSGNLARVLLEVTATDPSVPNLTVRIVGEVRVDATTGATSAVFPSVPAIPVKKFTVTFRGGTAPVLALPNVCGTAQGGGTFVPVNGGATVTRDASLALNTDCPNPAAFTPTLDLGRSTTAAGRSMTFTTTVNVPAKQAELSSLKMSLPAGLLGKISSIPACSPAAADAGTCGADSKVGTVSAQVGVASAPFTVNGSAYLVKGDDQVIARLAIVLPAQVGPIDLGPVTTLADLRLRGDYGLDIQAARIPTSVKGVRLDLHRLVLSIDKPDFMVNPISCGTIDATSSLGSALGANVPFSQPFTTTDCDKLQLSTSLGFNASPASPQVASAVTTQIRATAPAGEPLDGIRNLTVTMPEGMSLSPSAGARGDLAECSAGAFNAADIGVDAACPGGSKIGSVLISSPMVGDLTGDAYLGVKTAGHFAGVFLQARAADYPSLRVKLAGTLDVDPTNGRLRASFTELPQVQVSAIDLTLRGGNAPVLALPRTCGTFGADVSVLRHGGAATSAGGALTLDQDCPDPGAFGPSIGLSTSSTQAGADTALTAVVGVPARQQELTSLDLALPSGLLGRLTVAAKCPIAAAQANACGEDSVIGNVSAKVGVASAPYGVNGRVYLTDGFDGSIAGLMFALPAKVGPIDLGNVVTLAKIQLTGNDLQMRITADSIPTRVQGIPLSISELGITIDKPGMVVNATTCGDRPAAATFRALQGATSQSTANYAVGGCGNLNWQPSFKLAFSGPAAEIKKLGHPTIATVIEQGPAQGNLKTADVTLPDGVAVDLKNVNARICAGPGEAAAGQCGDNAKIGSAEILTSALPAPVKADIYMVKIAGQTLPGLSINVRDQIALDLVGITKLDKTGRVNVRFDGLPDAPISKMTLIFNGGATGVIQLGAEVCGISTVKTDATLTAHHGASKAFMAPIDCNGVVTPFGGSTAKLPANSSITFKPSGGGSALTFALANPNGISRITLKMPRGAIFTKKAKTYVKPKLTGAKATVKVTNGARTLIIRINPKVKGTKVTKVKFTLPKNAIKINIKVRKVLSNKKTSKKKKAKILAKLLMPKVTLLDGDGKANTVKIKLKVSSKVSTKK